MFFASPGWDHDLADPGKHQSHPWGVNTRPLVLTNPRKSSVSPRKRGFTDLWRGTRRVPSNLVEVRRHLGVETQRQWEAKAKAIARTTPVLLALFSMVCLMVHRLRDHWASLPRSTAWYLKPQATFSDCLALVRRTIWAEGNDVNSLADQDEVVISRPDWERVLAQLA